MNYLKLSLSLFYLFILVTTNGQFTTDFIEMRPESYFYQNQKTNKRELGKILKVDKEAYIFYKKYKNNRNIGRVLGTTGVLLGTHKIILMLQSDNEGNIPLFGQKLLYFRFSGLTFIVLGSTFYGIGVKRFRKSVTIYNNNLKQKNTIGEKPLDLNFGLVNHGIGFSLNF
ncbi:MAG: hypothetical protein AB8H03_26780 [Saprospiraceae bacterium]